MPNPHFYSASCYGFFPPLKMTSIVDVVVVVVVVVVVADVVDVVIGDVWRPSSMLPNPRKRLSAACRNQTWVHFARSARAFWEKK